MDSDDTQDLGTRKIGVKSLVFTVPPSLGLCLSTCRCRPSVGFMVYWTSLEFLVVRFNEELHIVTGYAPIVESPSPKSIHTTCDVDRLTGKVLHITASNLLYLSPSAVDSRHWFGILLERKKTSLPQLQTRPERQGECRRSCSGRFLCRRAEGCYRASPLAQQWCAKTGLP